VHKFQFFRSGGGDQVSIATGADLAQVAALDQKLWVALAMPTKGIAIAPETLGYLDLDGDGRIRVQDIVAAIAWIQAMFVVPEDVLKSADAVALSAIKDATVVAAAKRMLTDLNKGDATKISAADTAAIAKAFSETVLNGDGIVIPESTDSPELRKVIEDGIACVGSVVDRSGKPGLDKAKADQLFAEVDKRAAWLAAGKAPGLAALDGADATAAAVAACAAVRAKLDDYFMRCRMARFDDRLAGPAGDEQTLVALGTRTLAAEDAELAKLPLARIRLDGKLPLADGLNPAWSDRIATFVAAALTPILGPRDALSASDLDAILAKLAPYRAWLDGKPTTAVDALDAAWVERLASRAEPATADLRVQLDQLIAADLALAGEYAQISAVAKAVLLQRDFGRVVRNFVNFSDFYAKQDGVFQCGTLYLDARALKLCVPVADAAKHGTLATASDACLLYCDLARKGETKQIVAAVTNGDADNLFVGRNGIFYDRDGNDWDATIVKIVSNPISVRAAFWSPYKKLVKTIEDSVNKRAQAADEASNKKLEAVGADVANADNKALAEAEGRAAPQAAPKKIDLGTIAAIGVAIGGIGTLLGALLANLFGLGMWLPLGIVAIVMMISGPSMLLAWLKLRRRNLGPILDANGWAINGRARINVTFGAAMTELARLPPGAKRALDDPFADKRTPWRRWVVLVAVLGLAGSWYLGKLDNVLPDVVTSISVFGKNAPAYRRAEGVVLPKK
jgi:hypothetical protein